MPAVQSIIFAQLSEKNIISVGYGVLFTCICLAQAADMPVDGSAEVSQGQGTGPAGGGERECPRRGRTAAEWSRAAIELCVPSVVYR